MTRITRIAFVTTLAAALFGAVQMPAAARAASNIGHGTTCYNNYPVVQADGSIKYQRVCFKRA